MVATLLTWSKTMVGLCTVDSFSWWPRRCKGDGRIMGSVSERARGSLILDLYSTSCRVFWSWGDAGVVKTVENRRGHAPQSSC